MRQRSLTNAIIERKGPHIALLVTDGFADVLSIRNEYRYDMYDPQIEFVEPLVPRALTFEVEERALSDGTIKKSVDAAQITELAAKLSAAGVRSVAVSFLNAYKVTKNEHAVREALLAADPSIHVSLSSDVSPQMREYPRTSTAVVNAYTMPITEPYLTSLKSRLGERGFPNEPLIMLSSGGIIGADLAGRFRVRLIESGPAAGALVASYLAEELGIDQATLVKCFVMKNSGSLLTMLAAITTFSLFTSIGNLAGLVVGIGCFFTLGAARQAFHDMGAGTAVYKAGSK